MSGISRVVAGLLTAVATPAISIAAAHAQTAPAEQSSATPTADATSDAGPDIVVTATKREQALSDVPMSITAVSGADLAQKGIVDVEGLVKVTPGLSVVESGNGVPVYSLRGVGFFDTSLGARPTVSVYSDEIALPFSIMSQGAALDLQRVEVLKGPQGTLFGQNSTGGAINYVAAKPTRDPSAGGTVSYSRFNTVDATAYVSAPLSSTLGFRVAGRLNMGGDWQRSYIRDDTLGQKFFYQGRLLLDWKPSDSVSFEFNANGFHDGSDTQAGQLIGRVYSSPAYAPNIPIVVNQPVAPQDDRAADWDPGAPLRRDNDFYQFSLRGDVRLGDAITVTSLTAYSRMKIDQLVDQDGTPATASLTNVAGTLSSFSQELRTTAKIGPATIVIGGSYALDKSDEHSIFKFPYTTSSYSTIPGLRSTASGLNGTQRFDTRALFGNVDLDLGKMLTLHGGIRYTAVDLHYVSCATAADASSATTYGTLVNVVRGRAGLGPVAIGVGSCVSLSPALQPGQLDANLDQDNISWRAGVDFKPGRNALIYFNVSKGYKSGSAPTIPAIEQSELAPVTQESVLAYEAGFKLGIVPNRLDITGAIFDYEYRDKQLQGRRPTILGVLPGLVNVPRSRIRGGEFQVNARPVSAMRISIGGTYLESTVTDDFNNYSILGLAANFKGNAFPYTPKYQLVADWEYTPSISSRLDAVLGVNANYRSSTNAGFGNDPRLAIGAYTLVDARAGVKGANSKWSATLFLRNLTDKYYWTNVARLSDVIRRYAGQPRTYGIQVSTKF